MPTEKRARQRAARYQKQAELQRRQKRRRSIRRGASMAVIAAAIVGIVIALSSGTPAKKHHEAAASTTTTSTFPVPSTQPLTTTAVVPTCPPAGEAKRVVLFKAAPPHCIAPSSVWNATFDTSVGSFVVRMDAAKSYAAVNNFVFLAGWNYYNGTFFHRVIKGFMDQGGDPAGTGTGGPLHFPGYEFTGNTPPKSCIAKKDCYPAGSVAMANTGTPSTNGSQFFVVVGSGGLDINSNPVYTVFGQVASGMSVVDKINSYGAPASNNTGTPTVRVYLLKVTVKQVKS